MNNKGLLKRNEMEPNKHQINPPQLPLRFFRWFCKPEIAEDIEGDLLEKFREYVEEYGENKARRKFFWQIVFLFRPGIINQINLNQMNIDLLRNYTKASLRNLWKDKYFSAISVSGLTIGLASFLTVMLYVHHEYSYDKFHQDSDRIFRVEVERINQNGTVDLSHNTPGALSETLISEIPDIENATKMHKANWGNASLQNEQYQYNDDQFLYVDDHFFNLFSFPFIEGDPFNAFDHKTSIVLTESMARNFFGKEAALGKSLNFNQFNQPVSLMITGVIADVPSTSHLQFDFLLPSDLVRPEWAFNWGTDKHMDTYIKVKPETDIADIDKGIQELTDKYEKRIQGTDYKYFIRPLAGRNGIYLASGRKNSSLTFGNLLYLDVLFMIGLIVLLIAGVNYVNLTTARSANRAREIGIRKVVGAKRNSIALQFEIESVLLIIIAGFAAILLIQSVLPSLNRFLEKDLTLFGVKNLWIWLGIISIIILYGLLAGIYPSFYLSALIPSSALNHKFNSQNNTLRKSLVLSQLTCVAFLLIGIFIIRHQMEYIQRVDLGFDKDQVLIIDGFQNTPDRDRDYVVRDLLETIPGVERAGGTMEMEIGIKRGGTAAGRLKGTGNTPVMTAAYLADNRFMEVFGLEFLEGRNFNTDYADDLNMENIIVNEITVHSLGIEGSALGKQIVWPNGNESTIIGVVKDFHTSSLHEDIFPVIIRYLPEAWYGVVKLSEGSQPATTIAQIKEIWDEFVPGKPFEYYFMDEAIDQLYRSENIYKIGFSLLTGLAVLIACLGLYGLSTYSTIRRKKELGIRKVFGPPLCNYFSCFLKNLYC